MRNTSLIVSVGDTGSTVMVYREINTQVHKRCNKAMIRAASQTPPITDFLGGLARKCVS